MRTISHWQRNIERGNLFRITQVKAPPYHPRMHTHDFYEVFWIINGALTHNINGCVQPMNAGELCLIRARRDTHLLIADQGPFDLINLSFAAGVFRDLQARYFPAPDFWGGAGRLPHVYYLTEPERNWLSAAAMELVRAPQSRLLLDRFLLNLVSSIGVDKPNPLRACPSWLRDACDAIRRPAQLPHGARGLFKLAGRSPAHVCRALKKHTGLTPSRLVNQARLEHAVWLLLTTAKNVQEIMFECGYESSSYFHALFRRHYGDPPRVYREKYFKAPLAGP